MPNRNLSDGDKLRDSTNNILGSSYNNTSCEIVGIAFLHFEEKVYYIGKSLELMGITCLAAALFLGIFNPFGYSEAKAMGVEMGFLALGVVVFFVGRLIEKQE